MNDPHAAGNWDFPAVIKNFINAQHDHSSPAKGGAVPVTSGVAESPAGTIKAFAGATLPSGYLWCDGAVVSRTTYALLFATIGTVFGAGDGSTTFNVPDLKGRVIVGKGPQLSVDALGDNEGLDDMDRTPFHVHTGPSHTHGLDSSFDSQGGAPPALHAGSSSVTGASGTGDTGTGAGAYLVCNWIISTGILFTNATSAAPTAEVGPVAIAGSAGTFLRSDAAPKLADTAVTPATYGSATKSAQIAVDQQGRITGASDVSISGTPPGGAAGGDLGGTYPNPSVSDDSHAHTGATLPATMPPSSHAISSHTSDYAEGTWTPTFTNLTVVGSPTYSGFYTKIGRKVFVSIYITGGTSTAATQNSTYCNLPFTPAHGGCVLSVQTLANTGAEVSHGVGYVWTNGRWYCPMWAASYEVFASGSYDV